MRSELLWLVRAAVTAGVAATLALSGYAQAEQPYQVEWGKQLGTSLQDRGASVALDHTGNVYFTGYTYGDIAGSNQGSSDIFIIKYDPSGNELWSKQYGTENYEAAHSLVFDNEDNIYMAGTANGDGFLTKLNSQGDEVWSQYISTLWDDGISDVVVDVSGDIYVAGHTYGQVGEDTYGRRDALLLKYDQSGNNIWTKQFGSSELDIATGVAIDNTGNIFISAHSNGDMGNGNPTGFHYAHLLKFDSLGNQIWDKRIGSHKGDYASDVAVDLTGNPYLTGRTNGSLSDGWAGATDAYIAKFDTLGNTKWIRLLGSSFNDASYAISIDSAGNAYILGDTRGSIAKLNAGGPDFLLSKYDASGHRLWVKQIGTMEDDGGGSMTLDGFGNIYVAGITEGHLYGNNLGEFDGVIIKLAPPIPGDLNADGFVGVVDLHIVLGYWNQYPPSWDLIADPSGDGFVGVEDLNIVLGNWNIGSPPIGAVPEPGSLMLLGMGSVWLMRRH